MKYTKQEARKLLGVTKESSKDDIEKKYDIILKKYKILKMDGMLDEKAQADFENSTEAYRILMGYEVDEPKVVKKETYADKALEKAGIDRKKADNFFYYHKYHILISLVVIIAIILTIKSFVTRVEPDITVGMIGAVDQQKIDDFENKIKQNIPGIKEVGADIAILTDNPNDPQAYAYMSKAMVLLSASDTRLFLVNKYVYNLYVQNGAFMPLEDVAKKLNIDTSGSEYLKTRVVSEWEDSADQTNAERKPKAYKDAEPTLYGIDVTNSKFFKDLNIIGPEKILVVRAQAKNSDSKNNDLIYKLVELFTKN